MATGYRLARVRGVDVRLDPSWIVGFALITWGLAGALLAVHPTWGRALTLLVGAIAALSLFAAVVAHQAAEATMARAWGVSVRDITLHVFGGAARLTREPPTPRAELWMAIVGPIVSVTLGLVALGAGALLVSLSAPAGLPLTELVQHIGPVPTAIFSLAAAGLFVGLFNLLPGLPLDGGRIVRAVSWASSGDFQRATRVAAEAGRALGWTLTAAGLVVALGGELVAGLAIALLGWLVRAAAEQTLRGAVLDDLLEGMRVVDVMRVETARIGADAPVEDLLDRVLMRDADRVFVVFEGRRFAGLVTLADIRRVEDDERDSTAVREIMTSSDRLLVAREDEPLREALLKLRRADVSQLPVLGSDGTFVGLLLERDVTRWIELYAGVEPPVSRRRPRALGVARA